VERPQDAGNRDSVSAMKIKLYKRQYVVVAENLTWQEVSEAEAKARQSEASTHFHFYRHKFQPGSSSLRPWSLLAMPQVVLRADRGEDVSNWTIEIQDSSID
jgi:hypothetical protein